MRPYGRLGAVRSVFGRHKRGLDAVRSVFGKNTRFAEFLGGARGLAHARRKHHRCTEGGGLCGIGIFHLRIVLSGWHAAKTTFDSVTHIW